METLIWVYDSPFSRSVKWLLLDNEVEHMDHILSWKEMASDSLLAQYNPKAQVPCLVNEPLARTDSLLIALDFLPQGWHQTVDAKMYRLGDSDVEAAIIFLFRANLLKSKFGESEQSLLMQDAGVRTFQTSVDFLLDHLMQDVSKPNIGAVLLLSTLLASISMVEGKLAGYRREEMVRFASFVEMSPSYQAMIHDFQGRPNNEVPFEYSRVG